MSHSVSGNLSATADSLAIPAPALVGSGCGELAHQRQGVKHLKTELMEFQHDFETVSSNTVFPIFFLSVLVLLFIHVCVKLQPAVLFHLLKSS